MSEKLIEHPIVVIESLLKLGIGDKGRLLYLKKAIVEGATIHNSDKKFLNQIKIKLDNINFKMKEKPTNNFQPTPTKTTTDDLPKNNYQSSKKEGNLNNYDNESLSGFESGIFNNQLLLTEIKKSNSKLMDNLELLLISRENLSLSLDHKPTSFSKFTGNNNLNLLSMIKNNFASDTKLFEFNKQDVMTYTAAGLFVLWFVGYQNLIDIGLLQNISLGLSAGAAVAAGLFYKQKKYPKKKILNFKFL